jgi:hypothetical protein
MEVKVKRGAMAGYLQRACIDEHIDAKIKEYEDRRYEELNAYACAIDETMLYTLHEVLKLGKKNLRKVWEAMIRNRIAFRLFYRDGTDTYQEQATGQNVEDHAIVNALMDIGVDIKAWEREEIHYDKETGEVSFYKEGYSR